jgi:hypothetical protein
MKRQILVILFVVGSIISGAGRPMAAAQDDDQQIDALLQRVAEMLRTGDGDGYLALLDETADRVRGADFATLSFGRGVTRSVVKERSREELLAALPGTFRLTVDSFAEFGDRARVATWQMDLRKNDAGEWRIVDQAPLSVVENLYRLSVNSEKQFEARNFILKAEDLELTLTEGSVFVIDAGQSITGLVLLGRGSMRFHPPSDTEKGQVKIFAGAETLDTQFETAYVRLGAMELHGDLTQLKARPVDQRDLRRAQQVFRDQSINSYVVELSDVTPDTWSLLPMNGDFLSDVATRRFGTLTYSRSTVEAEDISVFERARKRTISIYSSAQKLKEHGGSYNEDELSDYDILDHDIDLSVDPERQSVEGQSTLRLVVRAPWVSHLTIKLADTLAVKSVVSDELGWLFSLRVKNQNSLFVNLPGGAARDTAITLRIAYSGRLSPQTPDRETIETGVQDPEAPPPPAPSSGLTEMPTLSDEPKYLYSNRSYWYPQGPSSDYATAKIQLSVPASLSLVASGGLVEGSPTVATTSTGTQRKVYQFAATQPVRYLSFLVSRFTRGEEQTIPFETSALDMAVEANPRQRFRSREFGTQGADIAAFYASLVGDIPYESFTLALVDGALPGGHSPAYFAMLSQPEPGAPNVWRNDPANFDGFPEFFLAHEIAHQWWGQAVGWGSYHDQWLSEGFAQYFAALYAQHHYGQNAFESALQHLRRWSLDQTQQGPVYLGHRLGHIKNDSRVFRAVVYNKGAAVLHMLRRLMGDDAFFRGLRRFYSEQRFQKATTTEFRLAMEKEAERPLERFFERWINGTAIPRITYSYRVEAAPGGQNVAVLHVEQTGEVFDIPLTVTLQYADRRSVNVTVPVTDKTVDARLPLDGQLRSLDISRDDGTLVEASKAN